MSKTRNIVIFVNSPNTDDIFVNDNFVENNVSKGVQHTDWANFPHLGILSLASYIESIGFETVYFDGVAIELNNLFQFIKYNKTEILAICCSAITANFGSSEYICRVAKKTDKNIATIFGNDHFSVMGEKIIKRYESIDYGIVGNEVYKSLQTLLVTIKEDVDIDRLEIPGLVSRIMPIAKPSVEEKINNVINYSLIDKYFNHSNVYNSNFKHRLTQRIYELTGRVVSSGVPVEIARGCIKFKGDDACSFCSIQYGGMWRNLLSASEAWDVIKNAHYHGYDYLYITADELPLTFARLLLDMAKEPPSWWCALDDNNKPMLVGYARADGIKKEAVMSAMSKIGFKILFVGIDAGAQKSLQALRKPLKSKDQIASSESMYESNRSAIENARIYNVKIKAGFVLGHIGMDKELLRNNINEYKRLLELGADVIISADIEMLSPEPGSKDFNFLISPDYAEIESSNLGVQISSREIRIEISKYYASKDIFDREKAISDYITAMMPDLTWQDLSIARDEIRSFCRDMGIVVGDDI